MLPRNFFFREFVGFTLDDGFCFQMLLTLDGLNVRAGSVNEEQAFLKNGGQTMPVPGEQPFVAQSAELLPEVQTSLDNAIRRLDRQDREYKRAWMVANGYTSGDTVEGLIAQGKRLLGIS